MLDGMHNLTELHLGGASALRSIDPLAELTQLRVLTIDSAHRVHDFSRLGALRDLRRLSITTGINSPRGHAASVEFVRQLGGLEYFLFAPIVDDLDCSPFLALEHVEEIVLVKTKGMQPTYADLEWALPGIQNH